ncbi:hypothetical protein BH10PAT3_BH10PAT3_7230 [soil metagenome]
MAYPLAPDYRSYELYIPPEGIRMRELSRLLLTVTDDMLIFPGTLIEPEPLIFDEIGVTIDRSSGTIIGPKGESQPTPLEFNIVNFLATNADKTQTPYQISMAVWKRESIRNTLTTHIHNIRTGLFKETGIPPRTIETVRAKGFFFSSQPVE